MAAAFRRDANMATIYIAFPKPLTKPAALTESFVTSKLRLIRTPVANGSSCCRFRKGIEAREYQVRQSIPAVLPVFFWANCEQLSLGFYEVLCPSSPVYSFSPGECSGGLLRSTCRFAISHRLAYLVVFDNYYAVVCRYLSFELLCSRSIY
jgi:hypothetical protein